MKLKNSIYSVLIAAIMFGFAACDDVLDIENIHDYDAEQVWNDEKLANAYMANLYSMFGNWDVTAGNRTQQLSGIHFYENRVTITNEEYKSWDYERIRLINQAIADVNSGSLSQEIRDQITAQALFMRAWAYFDMVKHHGGVPYIPVPQNRETDDLFVTRNSTAECFDLIVKDLDDATALLPQHILPTDDHFGKIDGNFALAFKAKVLLYKASPQFNPAHPWNNAYWQEAYTVNRQAYTSLKDQGYALAEDYDAVFLQERGPEVVFSVINTYPNKVANWDNGVRPGSESRGPAAAGPTWEFVKEFPMKDGRGYNDPQSVYHKTEEEFLQSYWENRDPRFEKSVVWNGSIYEVSRKSGRRQYTALGVAHELDDFGVNPKASINSTNLDRYSGFFVRKASQLSLTQAEVQQYDLDYIVMRFAEVMLNYAEAANETGHPAEALQMLREIRERAGIEPGAEGNYGITAITREQIREAIVFERNIEFCFEGKYFWDLRRLRMLDRIDNKTKHGVEAIAINPDGSEMSIAEAKTKADAYQLTEADFRYSVLQIPLTGVKVTSLPENYYFFPIRQETIDRNSKIEQNANWGGTFNPALE